MPLRESLDQTKMLRINGQVTGHFTTVVVDNTSPCTNSVGIKERKNKMWCHYFDK
jgi:hypothetical protein